MHPHWSQIVSLLALILLANALPALLGLVLGPGKPLDCERRWSDGRPILGPSKTWRGLISALTITPIAALALGLSWQLGLLLAVGAMAGDLLTSGLKRRLDIPSSASAPLLDPVPESLFPALLAKNTLDLAWLDVGILVVVFVALDLILTPIGQRLFPRSKA